MTSLWNGSGLVIRSNGTNSGATLWAADRESGTKITATNHDIHDENIADTIQKCLNLDGENSPTTNISWANNKILLLADGTSAQDALNLRTAQAGGTNFAATSGGTTAYTATLSPAPSSLTTGMRVFLSFNADNTGPSTLDLNGLGAIAVKDHNGAELPPGELRTGNLEELWYNGTEWRQVRLPQMPAGTISSNARSSAPSGYLLCFGQAISRATYPRLFGVIGTTYGVGDGSTTFNLPDLRGRVTAGQDNMGGSAANRLTAGSAAAIAGNTLGATGGAQEHTLTLTQIPAHDHSIPNGTELHSQTGSAQSLFASGPNGNVESFATQGGGQAHNNVQPTLITTYMIKT